MKRYSAAAASFVCFIGIAALFAPTSCKAQGAPPSITPGGIVPIYSTVSTIQPGEWVSIYGTNLANAPVSWNGDFPTSLGGTSVTIDGKTAFLSFVSPGLINVQAPNDAAIGTVAVVVTTPNGSAKSSVTLAQFGPSFLLLDAKHVAGVISRSNGSGAYGGGSYDIIGPTGTSLGYPTVAAKAGDNVALYGVGFGPTNPAVPSGQAFSGAAPTTNMVNLLINNVSITPSFAGLSGPGLYQINLTIPPGLGTGDVSLVVGVGGVQTPSGIVISLQDATTGPQIQSVTLSATSVTGGGTGQGTVTLSGPAPAGGAVVALSASGATVPATVTVPADSTSVTFAITTTSVTSTQNVTISASYAGSSAQATLSVTVGSSIPPFASLTCLCTFQPVGNTPSQMGIVILPNAGDTTYTARFPGLQLTGAASGQQFTFNTLLPSSIPSLPNLFTSGTVILQVTNASFTITLTPGQSAFGYQTGSVTGNLSVTGTPYPNGGISVTLSGALVGTYTAQ